MANPVAVTCPADTWTLVAEDVTAGTIRRLKKSPNVYLHTYVMTGGAAPTGAANGVPIFVGTETEIIDAANAIDVYIKAVGAAGEVRADLP